jgi:bacteriocin-like protein
MKLLNLFKKSTKKVAKNKIETLDKKQLKTVAGGATTDWVKASYDKPKS